MTSIGKSRSFNLVRHSAATSAIDKKVKALGLLPARRPPVQDTTRESQRALTGAPSWRTRIFGIFRKEKPLRAKNAIGPVINSLQVRLLQVPEALQVSPLRLAALLVPHRSKDASSGSQFISRLTKLPLAQREVSILDEIKKGNVPDFMRQLKPVSLSHTDVLGRKHKAVAYVAPDYVAIGSNKDFVRMPMTPKTAQNIADFFGASLPTTKLVNAIYEQSTVKHLPQTLGSDRESISAFLKHDRLITNQATKTAASELQAGHKKDIVNSAKLHARPDRVAIYGWHQLNGEPIQELSTVHHRNYVDYSHGVRLISNKVLVNGRPKDLADILRDPHLSGLVSKEGMLSDRLPD